MCSHSASIARGWRVLGLVSDRGPRTGAPLGWLRCALFAASLSDSPFTDVLPRILTPRPSPRDPGVRRAMSCAVADGVLASIARAERDAAEQIRRLTQRKDELLVELGGVREALEALHVSRRQLSALRAEATREEEDAPETEGGDGIEQRSGLRGSAAVTDAPSAVTGLAATTAMAGPAVAAAAASVTAGPASTAVLPPAKVTATAAAAAVTAAAALVVVVLLLRLVFVVLVLALVLVLVMVRGSGIEIVMVKVVVV